jgi:pantetheine-phosphate adenylyltransferase
LTKAIYPGSFDPITNGHIDIAKRAASIFDELVLGVYDRPNKQILFSVSDRVKLAKKAVAHLKNVTVVPYSGLTAAYAEKIGAKVMVRGLRMSSDFEWEFEMAMINQKLAPDMEVVCFMTSLQYQFLSSTLLKEAASLGASLEGMVPEFVAKALRNKFGIQSKKR